jgi:hypothetical protein
MFHVDYYYFDIYDYIYLDKVDTKTIRIHYGWFVYKKNEKNGFSTVVFHSI